MNENKRNLNIEELDKVAGGQITPEEAFERALKHANKKKGSVRLKKNELDFDDGIYKYEIEFVENGVEYEFDIDAESGRILKYDKDLWD
ncbi:MAG: PepSY domain-containing protein [Lachnospiraceae bacterium]|nr:PepSY domain-containing protein [Lachnospiraceae bacterium]